jgi:hypothetical protein
MIADLHNALYRLLTEQGQLPGEVDIRFEMPTRAWAAMLVRPTINFFLFAMEENTELRRTNMQMQRGNGQALKTMPPRRVDLRYMVSAITSDPADDHLLLWRTLAVLLKYQKFPPALLPEAMQTLDPPLFSRVGRAEDSPDMLDLWRTLDMPPRPALFYAVTVPLDLEIALEVPLVLTRTTRYMRPLPEDEASGQGIQADQTTPVASATQIGGIVRDQQGTPLAGAQVAVSGSTRTATTSAEGWYSLPGMLPGQIDIQITPVDGAPQQATLTIPSASYDVTLGKPGKTGKARQSRRKE